MRLFQRQLQLSFNIAAATGESPPLTLQDQLAEGGRLVAPVGTADQRLTLTSPVRYTEEQILSVLAGITAPTLLVLAEPSPPFLSEQMIARRVAQVPGIRVVRIPGSHHLHLEEPQPVARAILEFAHCA